MNIHVNPSCYDSRFCLPHGEMEEVKYDLEKLFRFLHRLEDSLAEQLQQTRR